MLVHEEPALRLSEVCWDGGGVSVIPAVTLRRPSLFMCIGAMDGGRGCNGDPSPKPPLPNHIPCRGYHVTVEALSPSARLVQPYLGRGYYLKVTAAHCQNYNPTGIAIALPGALAEGGGP